MLFPLILRLKCNKLSSKKGPPYLLQSTDSSCVGITNSPLRMAILQWLSVQHSHTVLVLYDAYLHTAPHEEKQQARLLVLLHILPAVALGHACRNLETRNIIKPTRNYKTAMLFCMANSSRSAAITAPNFLLCLGLSQMSLSQYFHHTGVHMVFYPHDTLLTEVAQVKKNYACIVPARQARTAFPSSGLQVYCALLSASDR